MGNNLLRLKDRTVGRLGGRLAFVAVVCLHICLFVVVFIWGYGGEGCVCVCVFLSFLVGLTCLFVSLTVARSSVVSV